LLYTTRGSSQIKARSSAIKPLNVDDIDKQTKILEHADSALNSKLITAPFSVNHQPPFSFLQSPAPFSINHLAVGKDKTQIGDALEFTQVSATATIFAISITAVAVVAVVKAFVNHRKAHRPHHLMKK
jgi:hypothetical protein